MMFEEGKLWETDAEPHQISVCTLLGRKMSNNMWVAIVVHSHIFETFSRKKTFL